jgi:hypothetical protein
MSAADIIKLIGSGDADDNLSAVFDALRARSKYVRTQVALTNSAELTVGTAVRITGGISPRYLLGIKGKVSPIDDTPKAGHLMIDINEDECTGRYGKHLRVPANCLARVTE